MRLLVVAAALLAGCSRGELQQVAKGSAAVATGSAVAAGSAAATGSAVDPWAEPPPKPGDPPSFTERHQLADEACPAVTGPYFYRIEKGGKTSHILGTRHLGVSLTKMPKPVHDAIAAAKLAVFEVAPGDDSDLPETKIVLRDALGPQLYDHYRE